jgi:pSer/pThr/pTyr-binding forkhead associated (FHA) protein
VRGLTLVGRRPEVVPDGALVVMDRGSTNGSILVRAGVTRRLGGGRPATLRDGDRVRFGDREMTVALLS